MADFYEIYFLQAHGIRSGDAITMRCEVNGQTFIDVIDGGYASTAPDMAKHLPHRYDTTHIDNVVLTHPHQDHAEGLAPILEEFTVGTLWMLRPWIYADQLLPHFARYESVDNLVKRLREDYPYVDALEKIAVRRRIDIGEPFQGRKIGPFTVLAPTPVRYGTLVIESEKTPQPAATWQSVLGGMFAELARPVVRFIREGWGAGGRYLANCIRT